MSVPYLNRELSWIEFNQRVLNEALRNDLPLLERVKFLAITASNLDEFFQVRIGGLMIMRRSGLKSADPSGLTPARNLLALRQRILRMQADQYALFNETLVPALEKAGIRMMVTKELSVEQSAQVAATFDDLIYPLLTPLAVDAGESPPLVPALQLVVACRLSDPETQTTRHALIPIPDTLGRRVPVLSDRSSHSFPPHRGPGRRPCRTVFPRGKRHRHHLVPRHPQWRHRGAGGGRHRPRRRDGGCADRPPLRRHRAAGTPLRRPARSRENDPGSHRRRHPGNLSGRWPARARLIHGTRVSPDFDHLRDVDWPGQNSPAIAPGASMFETIASGDLLLHHPYESFEPVLRLIEEAAVDPDVVAIKQVLYRTAKKSRIIDALIKAAENGKHVTVLVELKARFDEARNLDRADELQRAGAQIVYGVKGFKTHAKICLIVRRESGHLRRYVHLGTGNYNETTSRLYTDVSYLTCKPEYGNDASLFFNAVSGRSKLLRFQRLIPAPTAMKPKLLDLITGEAERAKQGLPARIIAKVNSLQDPEIINALYKASRAGVEVKLNVRGICCLKPGDPKHSKNIEVVSVIDRFLEHARVFYFHHGGDAEVYIASADWMTRNLEKRVELMIPIEETALKRRLVRMLEPSSRTTPRPHG
jgi:polyphosphate kinase